MKVGDYMRLLSDHGFRISPQRWAMAGLISGFTVGNSLLAGLQKAVYGQKIRQQAIDPPPLFVIGHWRSGTTLLHELLAQDPNVASPSTVECFLPNHFLISEMLLKPLLGLVLPARRPMDNMSTGPDLPQEDEFALIGMGAPTPYLRMAFPNDVRPYDSLLDMEGLPDFVEARFLQHLQTFFQSLMLKRQKRLLLKSPTHTGRMGWLANKFPGSRFIHISRNPVEVFLSTKRLWRSLDEVQGFQLPRYSDEELETMILQMSRRMYGGYLKARADMPDNRLVEIQFEQLMADPVTTIENVYHQLELDCPANVLEAIRKSMEDRKGHRAARYSTPPEVASRIMDSWQDYASAFGYPLDATPPSCAEAS